MTKHKIDIRKKRGLSHGLDTKLLKHSIQTALEAENVKLPCEISVLITDNSGIQKINREFRDKDTPTDVLSFPLQMLTPGDFVPDMIEVNHDTGCLPLGDIVLSFDRIRTQAEEFGQTPDREMAYLVVHSVLHLLGYDHLDEGPEKRQMRQRENVIVALLGFNV